MTNYIRDNGRQLRRIGALGAFTTSSPFNFRAAAQPLVDSVFATMPLTTHVVVAFDADGANPGVESFSDATSAGDAFENVIAAPGRRAYVAEFERAGIMGEQFFAVTQLFETRFTFESLKSALPWIAVGVAVLGGVLYYTRKPVGRYRSRVRVRRALGRARRSR